MTDLQRLVVDDHIRRLGDEGAARRAERERGRRLHPSAEPVAHALDFDVEGHGLTTSPAPKPRPATAPSRVRLGRWLMSVGTAIAGTDAAVSGAVRRAAVEATKQPCEDSGAMPHAV